jgi:4-hydroxybenzoate polyprenyltransferase
MSTLWSILISMRPSHWVKNLFLFAALTFSGRLLYLDDFLLTLVGFFLFSLGSSGIYLINDVADIEKDRLHPEKSNRPIPSGALSITTAIAAAVFLLLLTLAGAFLINSRFGIVAATYIFINIAYSFYLKDVVILDVMAIAISFVLRVVAGAAIIGVPSSEWLILCTLLLSLFLGFAKRRHELLVLEQKAIEHRAVLEHYSPYFLDQMTAIVTASTVMSYALYTISDETVKKFNTKDLIYTIPFVLYGIFRYLYLVHKREEGGNPTKIILTDIPLILNVVAWVLVCVYIIYRGSVND